jgi:hypothetical protein
MRDKIALAHRVNPLSALTSEFRRAMNAGKIRHLATPLNSVTAATLFPGTRNASVQHAAAGMRNARRLQLAFTYSVATTCGICCADLEMHTKEYWQ